MGIDFTTRTSATWPVESTNAWSMTVPSTPASLARSGYCASTRWMASGSTSTYTYSPRLGGALPLPAATGGGGGGAGGGGGLPNSTGIPVVASTGWPWTVIGANLQPPTAAFAAAFSSSAPKASFTSRIRPSTPMTALTMTTW